VTVVSLASLPFVVRRACVPSLPRGATERGSVRIMQCFTRCFDLTKLPERAATQAATDGQATIRRSRQLGYDGSYSRVAAFARVWKE